MAFEALIIGCLMMFGVYDNPGQIDMGQLSDVNIQKIERIHDITTSLEEQGIEYNLDVEITDKNNGKRKAKVKITVKDKVEAIIVIDDLAT